MIRPSVQPASRTRVGPGVGWKRTGAASVPAARAPLGLNARALGSRLRNAVGMSRITFGGGRELSVKIGMPNGLHKGAGLHRLTFPAEFDARNTIGGGVPLTLNVHAWLGASRGDWLGPLLTDEQIVTFDGLPFSANLVLALSDEQLAVIEQRRAGSDLTIWLTGYIVLGYDPAVTGRPTDERWPSAIFSECITVLGEAWVRLLSQAAAGMSLAIVVPVPLDQSTAGRVGKHLRDAIAKVNDGENEDAVTATRKAIEAMGRDWESEDAVAKIPSRQRSLEQRLAMLRHSLFAIACLSAHEDDVAVTVDWDREKALAVIAGASALAACREARSGS